MSKGNSEYEFYVGEGTHLEGASLDIHGTARIDGTFVGKISVKHLIVGENGSVTGDISGETALVEGVIEDTLTLSGKLEVTAKGKIRGKIHYGELETVVGAKLVGEISTDWDGDQTVSQPAVSDRLEAFSASLEEDSDSSEEDL